MISSLAIASSRTVVHPLAVGLGLGLLAGLPADGQTVHVSRFWHNHQPTYWPDWNRNGTQLSRVQYAWDSIVLKPTQDYGGLSLSRHPENNLGDIFGLDDRRNAYQSGPRNSLAGIDPRGGFAISYSGSLMDNVRQLGAGGHLGYGSAWNAGNREALGWLTPTGARRMDLVGFTYHHALGPLLPKAVLRKELQIFKQAWWKAWGGRPDLSDHSKGFFPTEMAFSRHMVDVLVDEGYEWVIVPSHHLSRTSPSYNDRANPEGSYNIFSSPPNRADQIGPRFDEPAQWWYGEPNPGNAAWNVSPYAYQLHRIKHVDPATGAEKRMIAVPSDDVLSYRFGYANEGIGKIAASIAPHAKDPARPVIVMPSTDGDNAWGGGSSSWFEATPQFFASSASAGYRPTTPQDFVNAHGAAAQDAHIEDGAWIFPEMDYGSPNFLKWIEPPVAKPANRGVTTVPGTQIDLETPGFALKFYSYAPLMAGANWCETAEQVLRDEGGGVQPWKIQAPYDWDGAWTRPNEVELAWHIYLAGLDSGFNYYGGLGNDDEVKPGLATRRAVEILEPWMTAARRAKDRTGPTVLKPQRFPYNPGGYTFGWFNSVPGGDTRFLKRMDSEFHLWTHAYDLSGIPEGGVKAKVRIDQDGINTLASNQNETYAGGAEVGSWVTLTMQKRSLPKTRDALNAAAANAQVDYFLPSPEVADYYFIRISDDSLPGFRGKLLDYHIEATDALGNVHRSDIQHVWVDDYRGAGGGVTASTVSLSPSSPVAGEPVTITYDPANRPLASASQVYLHVAEDQWANRIVPRPAMTAANGKWVWTHTPGPGTRMLRMAFTSAPENGSGTWDNNGGADWNLAVAPPPAEPLADDGIRVNRPGGALDLPAGTTATLLEGLAGDLLDGLAWTNLLTGHSGSIARGVGPGPWSWSANVPVAPGRNVIEVKGSHEVSTTELLGSDSAVGYTAWTTGSGGSEVGFGPWTLASSGSAGHFLASASGNSNLSLGGESKGFGLWANGGGVASATRRLPRAMQPGDEVTLRLDNNWIDPGGNIAVGFATDGGEVRLRFHFTGGESSYRVDDATPGRTSAVPYTSSGLLLAFAMVADDRYRLVVGSTVIEGDLAGSGAITRLVATNRNAGPGTERNLYLGTMSHGRAWKTTRTTTVLSPALVVADPGMGPEGFRITSIRMEGTVCHLEWTSRPGQAFRVEASTRPEVAGSWQVLRADVGAAGEGERTWLPLDLAATPFAGAPRLFLRVKTDP